MICWFASSVCPPTVLLCDVKEYHHANRINYKYSITKSQYRRVYISAKAKN
jgi:hypothetical protein